jgi:hypothetical protein
MDCVTPPLIDPQAVVVAVRSASSRLVPDAVAQFVNPLKVTQARQVCARSCIDE